MVGHDRVGGGGRLILMGKGTVTRRGLKLLVSLHPSDHLSDLICG